MPSDPQRVQVIFNDAVHKSDSELGDFLDRQCAGDGELRRRVEALISAHEQSGSFLDSPPKDLAGTSPTIAQSLPEQAGSLIGPFKLLQQIGEGGMGSVYMAEQIEPVERRVALKIIKPGMDTRSVIARFEAERQALAMMDHPNIAKILDVGTTTSGRPYFVMELVRGVPITQYCDEHHLTPRERLELFLPVCQAVQHAHQKGIIHRDIKPSNVLVAEYDDRAVPKIIDFGLAKAMEKRLTAKTMFTEFGQVVGTPDYMSPEQAKLNQMDIDTRSDIYSLGVLLYELLSGNTPFDRQRLRSAAFDELLRIIREEEPPKPSQRLSTVDTLPTVAANRHITPAELTRQLSGELDWIVMKTLEKDRARRYDTANGLANDLRRYLNDEPVEACPPSTTYRFRKFARRNKAPIAMATAVTLALVIVAIGSTIAASRFRSLANRNAELVVNATNSEATARTAQQEAEEARDGEQGLRVEAQRQTKIATDALVDARAQRERAESNFVLARSAVDEFLNQVTENELLTVPGMQSLRQELLSSAMEFYDNFAQDEENSGELLVELASAHYRIAVIHGELGQKEESSTSNANAIEQFEKLRDGGDDSLEVRLGLAKSYFRAKRYDDTVSLCREILETNTKHAPTRSLLANTYNSLAVGDDKSVDIATALKYHQQSLALREDLVRAFPTSPDFLAQLGGTLNNLGVLLSRQKRDRESLAMFQRGVSYAAEAYNRAPQAITWGRWFSTSLKNMAATQASFGEQDNALQSYQRYVAVRRKLAFENPAVPSLKGELHKAWMDLASYQRDLSLSTEAARSFNAARDMLENIPRSTPREMFELAIVYGALATPDEDSADLADEGQQGERQRNADLAMETIVKAVDDGYRDVRALQSHKYLAALRERDDFQLLVGRLEKEVQAEQLTATDPDTDEQKLNDRRQLVDVSRGLIGGDSTDSRHRKTLAATLHSIGVIETGLDHFALAELKLAEAIEIREELIDEKNEDPQTLLDLLESRVALGQVYWESDRLPEAHQLWQRLMRELETVSDDHQTDVAVLGAVGGIERQMCNCYGRLWLWPLAAEYAKRNARYDRRTTDVEWDARFAPLILQTQSADAYRQYCERWDEYSRQSLPGQQIVEYKRLKQAWMYGLIQNPGNSGDELLRMVEEATPDNWSRFCLAATQYRTGQVDLAAATLRRLLTTSSLHRVRLNALLFLAMSEWSRDRRETARKTLAQADAVYKKIAGKRLHSTSPQSLPDWKSEDWWWFLYAHRLRLEASRKILGAPTEEPWQQLIQARGYWLIGEKEQAEAELAAAALLAHEDVDFTQARARLLEEWVEVERAEDE